MEVTRKKDAIEEDIRKIIAKILEVDLAKVVGDAQLVEDLGADSMLILEIMVALDKKFKIEIAESDISKLTNLNSIIALVSKLIEDRKNDQ